MLTTVKVIAATAILIWLGGTAMAESPEPPPQTPSIKTEQQSDSALKAQPNTNDQTKSGTDTSIGQEKPSPASETKGHDQPKEAAHEASEAWTIGGRSLKITDTLLVVFTFCLFLATVALFWATRDLVEDAKHNGEVNSRNMQAAIAESRRSADAAKEAAHATRDAVKLAGDTAERQLRAYVGFVLGHVLIDEPEPGKIQAWVRIKNHGMTPAYRVRVWYKFSRLLTGSNPFGEVGTADNEAVLPPGAVATVTSTLVNPPGAMEAVKNRTYSFYIWGRVEYVDAFDKPRYVTFRGVMSGPPGMVLIDDAKLPGWGFQPTQEGNHQD